MMGSAAAPPKSQSQRQLVPQLRLLYAHLLAWSIWAQCRQNVPANSFDQSRARRERAPSDKPRPVGKVTAAMCKQWRKAPKVPQYGFAATFVPGVWGSTHIDSASCRSHAGMRRRWAVSPAVPVAIVEGHQP
ncbi:unnamed protein product [Effrenium voratum]|uniref:Uncharacterized protein n=1 Tax=Effrenium voratum TaxID=2562239 RepID=A0AA36N387_9DINO|nr:unnamed protein product [Effrenium voratum]